MLSRFFITAAAGLALAASPGMAQYALGDGQRLDANRSRTGGGRNNPVRDFEAEKTFRDSIVTGNAPAGLSFRGDAGYTAPEDLRVPTGSDAYYRFRRDSLYSGLSGMGIRGTEAIQRQFGLTTGNSLPQPLMGSLTVPRTYAYRPTAAPTLGRPEADERGESQVVAAAGGQLSSLRSTAAYNATRSMEPALLDVRVRRNGQLVGFMASGLRGIYVTDLGRREDISAPATGEEAEAERRIPEALDTRFRAWAGEEPAAPGPEAEPPAAPAWRRRLDELRATFEEEWREEEEEAPEAPAPDAEPPRFTVPEPPRAPDGETVRMLREAPGRLSLVGPGAAGGEGFDALMGEGRELLGAARYFDAEEKFTRALAHRPGDPLAAAGRVHAQIGAGLYRSAALNLRDLLTKSPEVIGARYEPGDLPAADRVEAAESAIRGYLGGAQAGGEGAALACLLGAYLGFQTDRGALTAWGLERWGALENAQSDALLGVARAVWLPPGPGTPGK